MEKEKCDAYIVDALQRYSKHVHQKQETLSNKTPVYSVKIVFAFLRAYIPIQKINSFHEAFEEKKCHKCLTEQLTWQR